LAQLKKRRIITSLGNDMYWVNVFMIRKGKPLTILAAAYEYSKKRYDMDPGWRPSKQDIRRFRAPGNVYVPGAELLLLEEEPAAYGPGATS
jgi:hypothetical protein